jgi:hypothetical protein
LGIDQSLEGRLARGRATNAARPEPGLILGERMSRGRAARDCLPSGKAGAGCRNVAAVRHAISAAARNFFYDARFGHDLPVLDESGALLSAAAR